MRWVEYFMGCARWASEKSKVRAVKVGAVAVRPDNSVVSTGFNGPPRGVHDFEERPEREFQSGWSSHAEENLVCQAARNVLAGTTVYVLILPCARCARMLIQSGVAKVMIGFGATPIPPGELAMALTMLSEAGVEVVYETGACVFAAEYVKWW